MTKVFNINELRLNEPTENLIKELEENLFVFLEMDEEAKGCSYIKKINEDEWKNISYSHIVLIVNKLGDDEFKTQFRRDSDHVRSKCLPPEALREFEIYESIEKLRKIIKEKFGKCIHAKLVIKIVKREKKP